VRLFQRKLRNVWALASASRWLKSVCAHMTDRADAFDGKNLLVCEKRCDQCLFSKAKIVNDDRQADLLTSCRRSGKYFICHKSATNAPVICRGFFDEVPNQAIRVARLLHIVRFVKPGVADAAKENE
jgi:hypothetical protein